MLHQNSTKHEFESLNAHEVVWIVSMWTSSVKLHRIGQDKNLPLQQIENVCQALFHGPLTMGCN
jgi:hypothetical protein